MAKRSCVFVASAVIFTIVNVITTSALKDGYERVHTYSYRATASVGVKWHISEYEINGLLKVQRDVKSNKYLMSLTDLMHKSYYGEQYAAGINESLHSIDNHILQSPFYVEYDEDGMFHSIEYQTREPEWSEKIKKSIGLLLQFNWSIVKRGLSNEELANETGIEEITVHGKCKVDYQISRKSTFTRNYELSSCKNFTSNIDGYFTSDKYTKRGIEDTGKWGDSSNHKRYILGVDNDVPIIKLVTSVENYQYSDNTDGVVFIKDNRPLLVKISQGLTFNGTSLEEKLLSNFQNDEESNADKKETKGFVDRTNDLLIEAHNYMQKNHLDMMIQGAEHRQVFNKIILALKHLESSDLDNLESKIRENPNSKEIRQILVQILPYVGTQYSLGFMLDVISKKAVTDELAINFFTTLPIHAERNEVPIEQLQSFLQNITSGQFAVSAKVYESALSSFSHLLNRNSPANIKRFIPIILEAFRDANTTAAELTFLAALVNVRDSSIVNEYTLLILSSILTSENGKDRDRLRLAAINIMSELLDEVYTMDFDILKKITTILKDKSESRSIRLAAYDLIIRRGGYAINILSDIGNMLSDDKDLYNYHLSTIEGLQQVGILNGPGKTLLNPSEDSASLSLSKCMIFRADNIVKSEILKNSLKIQSEPQTYLKLSFIYEEQSRISNWQIPSVVKLEVLDREDKKLTLNKATYFYTNFKGSDMDKEIFFDSWTVFGRNSRMYYFDSLEFKSLPNPLDLSDMILKKIHERLSFGYNELTTFSLATGFGIDAVFEHKYPNLHSTLVDYNWKAEDNCLEAKVNFSLQDWSNGYSGVSIYNPISGQTHSIRKTQQFDSTIAMSFIVKYDFSKNQLNFIVPIYLNESDTKPSGLALYASTSVGITDTDDEISCENCGFKVTARHVPVSLKFRRADYHGLLMSTMPYNCDLEQNFDIKNLIGKSDTDNVLNSCGFIAMIRPNTSKPFSQVELLFNFETEDLKNWEKPWYFLPGYKFYFDLLIANRQITTNQLDHLLKLDFNVSSTQGHFSNLLRFKFVKRNDDDSNFILCFDSEVNFPKIEDNHLPTEVTQSQLNAYSRVVMGQTEAESCSAIDFFVDFNVTGEVSDKQKNVLSYSASKSQCAKQRNNPLYLNPRGAYPLTEDCIREMIANTTFRRYKLDLFSEKFSEFSILQALLIVRSMQDKVKELATNSHNANVDVQMISPISEIRTTRQMSFLADYPVPNNYKNLPNVYFSQDFLLNFIDKRIDIVNIYPKIMVYNNKEKPFPISSSWNEIYTGVDNMPYKIYAHVLADEVISLKILYDIYELILKPKLVSRGTIDSNESLYAPEVYYNQERLDDFDERLHLFSSKGILFSLSKVDDYLVMRSPEIPVSVYYTTNSISIFQTK